VTENKKDQNEEVKASTETEEQNEEVTEEQVDQEDQLETAEENVEKEETAEDTVVEEKDEEETPEEIIARLESELKEQENERLRLLADFDNYKRRMREQAAREKKYRAQSLIEDLLPALDNFERALQVEVTSEDAKALKEGVEMVQRDILNALEKEGLTPIAAEGEPFDPNFHQAVMTAQEEGESGIVLEEFQKGYQLHDRVVRASMVKVND